MSVLCLLYNQVIFFYVNSPLRICSEKIITYFLLEIQSGIEFPK